MLKQLNHLPVTLTIKLARADPQGRGNGRDATTFLAVLQSRELQAQLDQARSEIRTDIHRALQTFVDCLQAASACMIKKIKSGGCQKSAIWFDRVLWLSKISTVETSPV